MDILCYGDMTWREPSKMNNCMAEAGFDDFILDFSTICNSWLFENLERCYKDFISNQANNPTEDIFLLKEPYRLMEWVERYHIPFIKSKGLGTSIAKAPTLLFNSKREDLYDLLMELTLECIKICQKYNTKRCIIEPPFKQVGSKESIQKTIKFYKDLAEAVNGEIEVLVTTVPYENHGRYIRGDYMNPYYLADLIDGLNEYSEENGYGVTFGICLDVGLYRLMGQSVYEVCRVLRDRICATYLSENDGRYNSHLAPLSLGFNNANIMNWRDIIRGLRSIDFDGPVIFDFRETVLAYSHLLWLQVIRVIYATATYLVWNLGIDNALRKYNKRVLFGAGRMCADYMKYYGKQFPPLFTCDNNSAIWGTTYMGLEVKNPQVLMNLPEDCAIFICNMYFDEIELQLKEMGVKNPIEKFNNEYLPYVDEVKAYSEGE